MEYTQMERLQRLWELVREDPDCRCCEAELEQARGRLEARTDQLSREAHDAYWEYPTCFGVFHGRILELVSREMRFPEEK